MPQVEAQPFDRKGNTSLLKVQEKCVQTKTALVMGS